MNKFDQAVDIRAVGTENSDDIKENTKQNSKNIQNTKTNVQKKKSNSVKTSKSKNTPNTGKQDDNSNKNVPEKGLDVEQVKSKEKIKIDKKVEKTEVIVTTQIETIQQFSVEKATEEMIKFLDDWYAVINASGFDPLAVKKKEPQYQYQNTFKPHTVPIRTEILNYIKVLALNSSFNQTQLLDLFLWNGIKSTVLNKNAKNDIK